MLYTQALVCQIVFVNNADDASGNFQFHPADGRVWSQRKTFKEVVGIPIRYFDASIAFVSCNLGPGDHDTYRAVTKKHAVATSLIHSFGMDTDRAAVDFPNLYHHTFLSGNLNYDVELPRQNLLNSMDQAFKAECLKQATDLAIESKFKPPSLNNNGQRHSIDRSAGRASSPSTLAPAALNANVPVEWNLLYFKSRNSLGRSSNVSAFSDDVTGGSTEDDVTYEEVYTSCDDELPFTLLQSPLNVAELKLQVQPTRDVSMRKDLRTTSVSENGSVIGAKEVKIKISDDIQEGTDETEDAQMDDGEYEEKSSSWLSFLDGLFPTLMGTSVNNNSLVSARRLTVSGRTNSVSSGASGAGTRSEMKKLNDLLSKSQLVADNSERKWKELLRFDELRAGIEAKEVFCGFEEPPISFLPSYPRKVGTAASFSMLTDRTCRDVFLEVNSETSTTVSFSSPPAYKDRVLAHSLQDTKQRLRNVKYWLCEEVTTSTHKPVCSVYELEIDRFFSYKTDEAALTDFQTGKHALREKTGVQEFKVKLVNLDANIWMIEANDAGLSSLNSMTHNPFRGRKAHYASPGTNHPTNTTSASRGNDSVTSSQASDSMRSSQQYQRSSSQKLKKKRSVANLVDRVLRKDRTRSSMAALSSKASTPNPYSDFSSDAQGSHPQALAGDRLSALTPFHLELVPVEPVSISTVFPLPSEDIYALQRKVYEVAHSVQNGFQSSARDEQTEESLLAFTNYRTVAWKEAVGPQGVTHTAITKAVNGVVHIAVTIKAEKGHGGQGVLCIQESELLAHATPVFSDTRSIPFDVTLTWGGKHVGYLHGDILSSL